MQPFGELPTDWTRRGQLRADLAGGDSSADDAPRSPLVTLTGYLAVAGGIAMVLGGVTSWNLFRVGDYHFHGKAGIAGGTHLATIVLGVASIVLGRSALRRGTPQARRGRLSATLVLSGAFGLFWMSQYADGTKAQLEHWVVDWTTSASIKASLQASIAQGDVSFSLRGGFYTALTGAILVFVGGLVLFVLTRRHDPVWQARTTRKPDQGLTGTLA